MSHTSTRGLVAAAALAIALALGACDSSAPPAFDGTYELTGSNGQALPVPYFPGSATQIESGELMVTTASHFNVTLALSGGVAQAHTFSFTRQGDSLVIAGMGMGGRVQGRTVRLHLGFPLPPSQGFGLTFHDLVFFR